MLMPLLASAVHCMYIALRNINIIIILLYSSSLQYISGHCSKLQHQNDKKLNAHRINTGHFLATLDHGVSG